MAKFRRGQEAAVAATVRSGSRFTPTFNWKKPGDEHYLMFLHPAEDILTLQYHPFIMVGENEAGKTMYKDFISPLDPAFEGEGLDHDPITDRFGVKPKPYNVALAVALEPIKEGKKIVGFEVKERSYTKKDGEEVTEPDVALVMQSVYTDLFPYLFTYEDNQGPIDEVVFQIVQRGEKTNKTLNVFALSADAPEIDFDPSEVFDHIAHLETLADPARFAEYIDPLPDDAVIVRDFGGKGDAAPKAKGKAKTSTRSKVKEVEEKPVRSSRFSNLKAKVEAEG